MVRVILWELRKFGVKEDTTYGSDILTLMVGKYLWVNLKAHKVMDDFLLTQFFQHQEVAPHITI